MTLDLMKKLRDTVDSCPPAERRVAIALLGNGAAFGLRSSAELASAVATSQPSVIRFVQRLGYARYSEFQSALRESLGEGTEVTPVAASYGQQVVTAVMQTLADADNIEDLARMLAFAPRVLASGGTLSQLAAHYLVAQLREKRAGTQLVSRDSHERAITAAELRGGELVVAFDYPRYESDTEAFAALCKDRGADVVLFTDKAASPIGRFADVTLRTRMVALSGGDSLVPALALIDQLMISVIHRMAGRTATMESVSADHLRRLEMREISGPHTNEGDISRKQPTG